MPERPPRIFDRKRIRAERRRRAGRFSDHDFLHRRAMADIVDRLESVTRGFDLAAFYGAGDLTEMLTPACGVKAVIVGDLAEERLGRRPGAIVFDEERQPFADNAFDLVVSLLTLHSVNDLIGALTQWRRALKPDGLFIAALFGGETLAGVKRALFAAETEIDGGAGPRIAPFAGLRDLGGALQRSGFAMPVADIDSADITYREPLGVFRDLKGLGERGGLHAPRRPLSKSTAALAAGKLAGEPVRFDIIFLTGWAPDAGQPKPLKPGSARRSLADAVRKS